jgi:YfiR/HmsC-like
MRSRFLVPVVFLICALAPPLRATSTIGTWLSPFQAAELVEAAAHIQATNTVKALEYDLFQKDKEGNITIGVVYSPTNRQSIEMKDAVIPLFVSLRVRGRQVVPVAAPLTTAAELAQFATVQRLNVIFLMPGTAQYAADIAQIASTQKILTVAAVSDYSKYGIALTFSVYRDKVRPNVDIPASMRQGTKFDSDYLDRARVRR